MAENRLLNQVHNIGDILLFTNRDGSFLGQITRKDNLGILDMYSVYWFHRGTVTNQYVADQIDDFKENLELYLYGKSRTQNSKGGKSL